jgi:hypothetical protein
LISILILPPPKQQFVECHLNALKPFLHFRSKGLNPCNSLNLCGELQFDKVQQHLKNYAFYLLNVQLTNHKFHKQVDNLFLPQDIQNWVITIIFDNVMKFCNKLRINWKVQWNFNLSQKLFSTKIIRIQMKNTFNLFLCMNVI